eukprot:3234220-Prymnesium_polylepis.1
MEAPGGAEASGADVAAAGAGGAAADEADGPGGGHVTMAFHSMADEDMLCVGATELANADLVAPLSRFKCSYTTHAEPRTRGLRMRKFGNSLILPVRRMDGENFENF